MKFPSCAFVSFVVKALDLFGQLLLALNC
jgi:hypothetical protein